MTGFPEHDMPPIEVRSHLGGLLRLDMRKGELGDGAAFRRLKGKPGRLMHLLLANKGRILSKRVIFQQIWGYDFDPGTKIIEVQVYHLRAVLAALNSTYEIRTYRGRGISLQEAHDGDLTQRS